MLTPVGVWYVSSILYENSMHLAGLDFWNSKNILQKCV